MNKYLRSLAKDCMAVSSSLRARSVDFDDFAKTSQYPYNLVFSKISKQDADLVGKIDEIMVGVVALIGDKDLINKQVSDLWPEQEQA